LPEANFTNAASTTLLCNPNATKQNSNRAAQA
jgi:hypothetical protein